MFDENEWVSRCVQAGGDEANARVVAARMKAAQLENSTGQPPSPATDYTPFKNIPSSKKAAQDEKQESPPAASDQNIEQTTKAGNDQGEADLFGFDESAAPASPKKSIAKPTTPLKRGRKPAAFNDTAREKTQRELDLFHLSLEIEEKNAKETGDLGYIATAMIYASMPHSKIDGGVFKRRNGSISLTILNDPDIGLPYGKLPRIITAFLCTEAKRHKDTRGPEIHLGQNQKEFMTKLGLSNTGGVRGNIKRVNDQAQRLFTSTISLVGEPNSQFHWKKVNITDEGMILWNPHNPDEKSQWQSKLTLGPKFYSECIDHSMPIDLRVLQSLQSPLAIDIYVWLTYRYNSIVMPTPITWKQLQWQFGSNYPNTPQGERDFKVNFKKQLRNVLAIYREAKIDVRQDSLLLLPSRPHVLPESIQQPG